MEMGVFEMRRVGLKLRRAVTRMRRTTHQRDWEGATRKRSLIMCAHFEVRSFHRHSSGPLLLTRRPRIGWTGFRPIGGRLPFVSVGRHVTRQIKLSCGNNKSYYIAYLLLALVVLFPTERGGGVFLHTSLLLVHPT